MLNTLKSKNFLNAFLLALGYGICFYIIQVFLFQRDFVALVPNEQSLLSWDAGWYWGIVEKGYYLRADASNTAFYILFPWIWKLSHLGSWGMSVLNIAFFSFGFALLLTMYTVSSATKLVWLTVPSFYFFFIPYSEALFFMLGAIIIWAIHHNKNKLLWITLFLFSLVRPVSLIFIVAFVVMEVLTGERRYILKSFATAMIKYCMPLLLGLVFFIWYQHYVTGEWFSFFKQEGGWGHKFSMPALPFNVFNGPKLLWLNAIAMFIGFIAVLMLVYNFFMWLIKNSTVKDKVLTLSNLYLAAILMLTILYNPKWAYNGTTTSVHDAHRYLFCSPFFLVFLHRYTYERVYQLKDYLLVFLLSNVFWLLFASYSHIMFLLYLNFCTGIVLLYMASGNKKYSIPLYIITAINFFAQVCIFQFFINQISPG